MTYQGQETSVYGGQPVELYRFKRRAECWLYTSADTEIVYQAETYQPVAIARTVLSRSSEPFSIEIEMDRALQVVPQFVQGTPPTPVYLTIIRHHRGDAEDIVVFDGEVANVQVEGEQARIRCTSELSAAGAKAFPRLNILRTCPHALYDTQCGLDPADWMTAGTVTGINGLVLTITEAATQANGYFAAGFLRVAGTDARAFITAHSGSSVTLLTPVAGLTVPTSVELYAGCDRRVETCRARFDNVPNFGGFPFHPERDPFIELGVA